MIKYERVPVPVALLERHCADTALTDIRTYGDMEAKLAVLFLCVEAHNKDKGAIEAIK